MRSEEDLSYGEAHLALSFGKECDRGLRPLHPCESRKQIAPAALVVWYPKLRTRFGPPAAVAAGSQNR